MGSSKGADCPVGTLGDLHSGVRDRSESEWGGAVPTGVPRVGPQVHNNGPESSNDVPNPSGCGNSELECKGGAGDGGVERDHICRHLRQLEDKSVRSFSRVCRAQDQRGGTR